MNFKLIDKSDNGQKTKAFLIFIPVPFAIQNERTWIANRIIEKI